MDCVSCNEPLVTFELEQVEVDHCLSCGGTWLDAGELDLLLGEARERELLVSSLEALGSGERGRKCPLCLKRMDKVRSREGGAVLDRCGSRHGLWFDGGELATVLRGASLERSGKVSGFLQEIFRQKAGP